MKKITLLVAVFALGFSAVAQNEFENRPNDNGTALISTNGDGDAGVFCGDFFTLAADTTLGTFFFPGFTSSGGPISGDVTGVDFFIYADGGGFPNADPTQAGAAVVDLPNTQEGAGFEFTEDMGNPQSFTVNVTAANGGDQVTLPAGDYWVVFAPAVIGDSAGAGRWNWTGSLTGAPANEPVLIDPDDLFGAGATDWTSIAGLIGAAFPSFGWIGTDEALGLGDNDLVGASVYPNPATNVLNIAVPSNTELQSATLFDVLGKNTGATLVNGTINISGLAAGVYILNVETNNGSLTQKVIKQ
jgi:hypothetical protein